MVSGPLSPIELASILANGEDSYHEFKEAAVSNAGLAKELCAFLNAGGGRVLIGVSDDGEVLGAGEWDEERVVNVVRGLLQPGVIPGFQRLTVEGDLDVVVVTVEQGVEKPYAAGGGESLHYYIRVGTTSRDASRDEIVRLTQASGAVAGDLRPVLDAEYEDLDEALLERQFSNRRTINWPSLTEPERRRLLVEAEILHRTTGGPTIGGLLCFGQRPQRRLPYATVLCTSYPGEEMGREILDRHEALGRVDEQIEEAVMFADRNLRRSSTVAGIRRTEEPRPSLEMIREIIANGIAHRHYGITGPVQLRMFSNRLEVVSPGDLPNGVTPASMRAGVTIRRNQFIMAHLVNGGLVEALGRGFLFVAEEAVALGLPEPLVQAGDGFVVVSLATRVT